MVKKRREGGRGEGKGTKEEGREERGTKEEGREEREGRRGEGKGTKEEGREGMEKERKEFFCTPFPLPLIS